MQEKAFSDKAIGWILDSGIQESNGGFCAWINLDKGKNSFQYSEVTGYGLSTLSLLNGLQGNKTMLERAENAAKWLSEKAITKEGAVLARLYQEWEQPNAKFSFQEGNCYSFDAGIVLNGLVELHSLTGQHLELAQKIGDFLLEKMLKAGKMHAVYNVKEGKALDSEEKWSTQSGPYHAKVSIGLLKLAKATKQARFREAAIALCESALQKQEPDGRFVTNSANQSTHLHPHCYAAEGLLFAGQALGENRFIDAAEKAVEWALENQAGNGGINAYFEGQWNQSQRSDVLAQALRLGLALKEMGRLAAIPKEKLSSLGKRLLEFQHESGGFLYGKELDLAERNCANAWCTMFALQALLWQDSKAIDVGKII